MKNHTFFGFNGVGVAKNEQGVNNVFDEIEHFFSEKSFETSMDFADTEN